MIVVYGRRRIGKSTLINEFVKDKKAIFYTASKVGKERNAELFAKQVLLALSPRNEHLKFDSLEGIFDFIATEAKKDKIILIIDELPYWAEKDESFLSILQKYRYLLERYEYQNHSLRFFAKLYGKESSKRKSPLFGRRDSQMRVDAFNYLDSSLFVPDYSLEDKAIVYGITGGVPKYLSLIDSHLSLDENIIRLFFTSSDISMTKRRIVLSKSSQTFLLLTTSSSKSLTVKIP